MGEELGIFRINESLTGSQNRIPALTPYAVESVVRSPRVLCQHIGHRSHNPGVGC